MSNSGLVTMTFNELDAIKATARREAANEAFEKAALLADFATAESSVTALKHPKNGESRDRMFARAREANQIADAIRTLKDSIT